MTVCPSSSLTYVRDSSDLYVSFKYLCLVTSANNIRFNILEALLMLLMYSKKTRGPRIEPWEPQKRFHFLTNGGHYIQHIAFCLKRNFISSLALSLEYRNVRVYQKGWYDLQCQGFWQVKKNTYGKFTSVKGRGDLIMQVD